MPQIFGPAANTWLRMGLVSILAVPSLLVGFGIAVVRSDYWSDVGYNQPQPVPFSHKHHVGGLGLDCRYCHASVETSKVAGVPPTHTCMTCHSQLWTNAALLAPVRESLAKQQPIRWTRVHNLPDYVYFDHSIHIAKGVGCSSCHGAVDTMPLMHKAEPLSMMWCLSCHRGPEKFLRPRSQVFAPDWKPPKNQDAIGRQLLVDYHIEKQHLTDCSVCHR